MELHFGGDPAKKMKERSLQPQPVLYGKAKTAEMLSFWGKESFKEGVGSFRMQFSAGAAIQVHFIQ